MRRTRLLVLSVSVVVLASCASLPVTDETLPTPDISAKWNASENAGKLKAAAVRDGWLEEFKMADLSAFVDEVIRNNPDFRASVHRMQSAGFNADVARGNYYPTLNTGFGISKRSIVNPFIPSNDLSFGFNSRWEIDVWGKIASQTAGANADFAAAIYDLEGARLSLAAQVAQAWFDIMEADAQLVLAKETVVSYERTVHIVGDRFRRGLSTGLDLRLTISNLEAARATQENRRHQLDTIKRRLEILAGRYPAAKINATGTIPDLEGDVPVGLPMSLLERRPDLRAAREKLQSAGYNSQVANKSLLPSVSLTSNANNSSDTLANILKLDNIFWNIIGNITQPIFQGGKLRYTAKAQKELFEAGKEDFRKALLVAFREVEDALSNERALKEQVKHTAKAAETAIAAEKVALDQYSRGLIKIAVLLDSQRRSLNQQSQLLTVKRQRINNRIALHLALGGDFVTQKDIQAQPIKTSAPAGDKQEGTTL